MVKLLLTQKKIARELVKSGIFNSEQQIVNIAVYEWMNKQGLFKDFLNQKKTEKEEICECGHEKSAHYGSEGMDGCQGNEDTCNCQGFLLAEVCKNCGKLRSEHLSGYGKLHAYCSFKPNIKQKGGTAFLPTLKGLGILPTIISL